MSKRNYYNFAGCTVLSSFEIPELTRSSENQSNASSFICDINYKESFDDYEWDHTWLLRDSPSLWYKRLNGSHLLRFSNQIEFSVSQSLTHVMVYSSRSVTQEFVCHALVDQLLPRLIAQRGKMVLHGCGLLDGYNVTLFLGESGWGKSTLAHLLSTKGMTLVSDDCLVLSFGSSSGNVTCTPTYPSLRLREEGVREFFSNGLPSASISIPEAGKYRLPVTRTVESDSYVLNRIVFLSDPAEAKDHVEVFDMPSGLATIKLVSNCFRLDMSDNKQTISLLDKAATLVETVGLYRLSYPHDYSLIDELADVVAKL